MTRGVPGTWYCWDMFSLYKWSVGSSGEATSPYIGRCRGRAFVEAAWT